MRFKKKKKEDPVIPTASMPDIVFILTTFFMVSTVFQKGHGLPVILPQAVKVEKMRGKRDVGYLWVDRTDRILIDDRLVTLADISELMYMKRADPISPIRVVSMKVDEEVKMGIVNDVQEELKKADCLNISYGTRTKAK